MKTLSQREIKEEKKQIDDCSRFYCPDCKKSWRDHLTDEELCPTNRED